MHNNCMFLKFDLATAALVREQKFPDPPREKVLILGGGGREHAIARSLSMSPFVKTVFVSPGNSGTALQNRAHSSMASETATTTPSAVQAAAPALAPIVAVVNVPDMSASVETIIRFVQQHGVKMVVVGAEQCLADGVPDALREMVCNHNLSPYYINIIYLCLCPSLMTGYTLCWPQ